MEEEKTTTTETATEKKKNSVCNGKIVWVIVLLVALGALVWAGVQFKEKNSTSGVDGEISFDTTAQLPSFDDVPDVVAKVGDVELTKKDYMEAYAQSWQVMVQQGVQMNDAQTLSNLSSQVLDILVNAELLAQAATAAGISVTDEDVEAEISLLETQFGGETGLEEALVEVGMDADMLQESVAEQILIKTYLENSSEVSGAKEITDADVEARYNEVLAQSTEDLPPLADVADVIKMQLETEAEQEATNTILERLHADTEVQLYMNMEEV